ncbi:MAG TPA: type II toxin-antitoxin system ParD family antitoxin, partial [Caulobacteraceae bacterium]|nr:type II toxin-antitoxin system ParD family antitoxin [Caulobacteraceae bacterium]
MRSTSQLSITLPVDMVDMIKGKVASGAYASDSEVVREGLRALAERDLAVERWLRDEVVPTAIAHAADPSRAIPGEEIF